MDRVAARRLASTTALLALAAALLVGGRPRVSTQCTTTATEAQLSASLAAAVDCNAARLRDGAEAICTVSSPPACSRTLVHDAVTLAYGAEELPPVAHDPDVLGSQFACQQAIGDAVAQYVTLRLKWRLAGLTREEADALARPALDALPSRCSITIGQDAGGVVLPVVGSQCAAVVGAPGSPVDAAKLAECLRQLLAVWVDRIGPDPLPLRPNIVFVLTDDQRWDTTDATHALPGQVAMPSVRGEVAAGGVEFTHGFATTPLCCPSRLSILSGQYAHTHGIHVGENAEVADFDDSNTIATRLQAAGYRTGLFGKYANGYGNLWQSQHGELPYVPPGWDDWRAFKAPAYLNYVLVENGVEVGYGSAASDYSTDVLRDKTLDFIADSVARGQPFFAYYAPIAPHSPWQPAARHLGTSSALAPYRPPSFNEADASDKPTYIQRRGLQDALSIDSFRRRQMEMLLAVDEALAAIAQQLRDLGVDQDTLLVFTSDNGYFWGEHRLVAKNRPYEEDLRVPYLIRYPRLAPLARSDDRLVTNLDFAPTFSELAGAGTPAGGFAGRSLVQALDGSAPSWRSDFLTEGWPDGLAWLTLHEARWKYTEYQDGDQELYDLLGDPYELQNVASDPANASRIAAMAARIRALRPAWPSDVP
jgi:arylsulfatase A-like enzyme